MDKVFCISAGQLMVKKTTNEIHKKNRYLNYGLLSLATELKNDGFDTVQIHGNFEEPIKILEICISLGLDQSSMPILISIPSFYAVSWVNEFILLAKERSKARQIILGGRWVIADKPELTKEIIPEADIVVSGLANTKIVNIVTSCSTNTSIPNNLVPEYIEKGNYPSLDYSILYERSLYNPSIEVSRGCGMGCSFCQEKDEKINPLKPPKDIITEIKETIISDDLPTMKFYFEASMFIPNAKWVKKLIIHKDKVELDFEWRTEARVDTVNPKLIPLLARSGLKVLDLGLESASPKQLLRMKKTKKPESYLLRASKLLKKAYEYNIYIKINVLLTAGETEETINTTVKWLETHKKYIKGVSVGPVIVFGWKQDIKCYIEELSGYGASVSHSPTVGVTHLNLSNEINYQRSIDISSEISQRFMTDEDYFYLKSFSYFSRDYTFDNFLTDVSQDSLNLNFSNKI